MCLRLYSQKNEKNLPVSVPLSANATSEVGPCLASGRATMQFTVIDVVFLANASLVGAGIYLSAYLKRKAEGLATKEEFEDLKKQTAELTRTTKEIEAEVSTGIWDRQKRWEMKREVLFDAAKHVAKIETALSNLNSAHVTADKNKNSA